ncbi:DUF2946 family protein [Pseudomonas sp. NPDC007930]|uniref:DUF2946 family protein n=1 Tax=Pseudomonas sp. NPDC007930 TaxID=3364417 RepID=UPI0036DFB65B
MFSARGFRAHVAWVLFALVLLNGLACSFGHGLMMAGPPAKAPMKMPAGMHMDHGQAMADLQKPMPMPMQGMQNPFEHCFFASTVPLALLVFAALGWLLRSRRPRPPLAPAEPLRPPRWLLPALNPQAP